jgi:Tfp pilus assembly protein PilF
MVVAAGIGLLPAGRQLRASEDIARAQASIDAKKPLDAVQSASEAARLDPARGHSWAAFGSALSAAGSPNAAQRAFLDAADREPWQPLWWRNAAVQALAQKDERSATTYLQRAVSADPFDATSLDLLSRLAFNRQDFEPALDYGRRVVRLLPASVAMYEAPVRAALQLHRLDDAKQMLAPGIERTNSPHLRVLLAQVYLESGDIREAKDQIDAALKVAPNDPEVIAAAQALQGH